MTITTYFYMNSRVNCLDFIFFYFGFISQIIHIPKYFFKYLFLFRSNCHYFFIMAQSMRSAPAARA